ncbi:MAG: cytidine deaminase [Ilumatobacter sp.]
MTARMPDLFDAAVAAQQQSYSPYSKYPVGAAIRTTSGAVFTGCNVENSAYPEGTCAEAGAIAAMVLAGERAIVEVLTVTGGETPGTPCGGCRQKLREFAGPGAIIHATTNDGAVLDISMADLLPSSFGPEFLLGESAR